MLEEARPCWILYLLECQAANSESTFYTGITTDLERRFNEHLAGLGARYTRSHPPLRVLAIREYTDRASASRAEAAVKKLPRQQKLGYFK